MASFYIVGTGTGTGQYIIPEAKTIIDKAEILIGGERNLAPWIKDNKNLQKYYVIKKDLKSIINWIKADYENKHIVVLVSGDPGFYSLLSYLRKFFKQDEIIVIPGLSSMQVAFARLALPWQDACLLNLHGRNLEDLDSFININKIGLLTDPQNNPKIICSYLFKKGRTAGTVYICSNLGYPDEKIEKIKLFDFETITTPETIPTVMVITNE